MADSFTSRSAALATDADAFAPRLARVRELLAEADAICAEIKAAGFTVGASFPLGVQWRLTETRFQVRLHIPVKERS